MPLYATLVLLLDDTKTVQSVSQLLPFVIGKWLRMSFFDAVKNCVTSIGHSLL